jgi:hippurate hydrolase
MIKEGLFEQFPMDAVFGMHNWPGMKAGQFAVSPGCLVYVIPEFSNIYHNFKSLLCCSHG